MSEPLAIYLLEADGLDASFHPSVVISDFGFLSREQAEQYIPTWRKELLAPDENGDPWFIENPRDTTSPLIINVREISIRKSNG
jgi:hypothetical protein